MLILLFGMMGLGAGDFGSDGDNGEGCDEETQTDEAHNGVSRCEACNAHGEGTQKDEGKHADDETRVQSIMVISIEDEAVFFALAVREADAGGVCHDFLSFELGGGFMPSLWL